MTGPEPGTPDASFWDVPAEADAATLRNALATAREVVSNRDTQIRALDTQTDALRLELESSRRTITETTDRLRIANERAVQLEGQVRELTATQTTLNNRIAELALENETLKARAGAGAAGRTVRAFGDLVRDVRMSFETVNTDALREATGGKQVYLVDQIEIEAKGGLDLQNDVKLIELDPGKLGPETVSTVRFSLRPATQMRVEPDDAETPPTTEPTQTR